MRSAPALTPDERVKMYSDLIQSAHREITEARERIAEYAYQLEKAALESVHGTR